MVAKILEDISAEKVPPGKCGVSTPSLAPQPRELEPGRGIHITPSRDSVLQQDMESARDTGTLSKNQLIKSHSKPLTLGSSRGKMEWTRDM